MADPHADPAVVASAYQLHREGLSQRAIADQLGIAQSTVSAHIRRGRAAQAAIALHDVAEQRMDSDGFLVDLREWLADQKDACESVTEAAALVRELRQIEGAARAVAGPELAGAARGGDVQARSRARQRPDRGDPEGVPAAERRGRARAEQLRETDPGLYDAVYTVHQSEMRW